MLARLAKFQTTMFHARTAKERGATAVEYGLLVALIAAVIVAVVVTLGEQINNAFSTVSAAIQQYLAILSVYWSRWRRSPPAKGDQDVRSQFQVLGPSCPASGRAWCYSG